MSLYTRVHTPNSPLLPLSPLPSSTFLSPYIASLGSRRSFTPNHLNILPPPSLSPIRGGKLSIKRKSCDLHDEQKSSESKFKRPLPVPVQSSLQKSMKKVRSSARLICLCCYISIAFFLRLNSIFDFQSFFVLHFTSSIFQCTEKLKFEIHMLVYH